MSTYFSLDDGATWVDLGYAISDITFSPDLEEEDPHPLYRQRWVTGMEPFSMEFPVEYMHPRVQEVLWGFPFHPWKHKGLTGKAYRQACRAYQRRLKAFRQGREDWRAVT